MAGNADKQWRVRLRESDAQRVLLAYALDEEDRAGLVLSQADTRVATRAARAASDDDATWLGARATALVASAIQAQPRLERLLVRSFVGRRLMPLVAVAFVLGLATNALGPSQRIHVLALPLLGLLAWNVTTMAFGLARAVLPLPAAGTRLLSWIQAGTRRWTTSGVAEASRAEASTVGGVVAATRRRYWQDWAHASRPLALARLRRFLHLSSVALIAGVVVGMYARGLGLAYQATWESTFLGAGTVQAVLDMVLAPASIVLGQPVPDVEAIRAPAAGDAAPWIHLWAVTAALVVGVPRLLLSLLAAWHARRLHRKLPVALPGRYRRRLLVASGDVRHHVDIVPYSYQPAAPTVSALEALTRELFGPQATMRVHASVAYGEDAEWRPEGGPAMNDGTQIVVVLFNLAQTPEAEVHGAWLAATYELARDADAFLAVVDGEAYRSRLGAEVDAPRLATRRAAWDRIGKDAGIEPVHVDLALPLGPAVAERWLTGARPVGALEALLEAS